MNSNAYNEGFDTGKTWDNDWRPGGPWVPCPPDSIVEDDRHKKYVRIYEECVQARNDYLEGFDNGVKERVLQYSLND